MTRPSWDEVWMASAEEIALRSRCARADVGCVLVSSDNQVVAQSYVGPPPEYAPANRTSYQLGLVNGEDAPDCTHWCPRSQPLHEPQEGYVDCVSSHAEMNAIARADFSRLKGGSAYVNGSVCINCAKLLAASGVGRVVMKVIPGQEHRRPERTISFLRDCGIYVKVV